MCLAQGLQRSDAGVAQPAAPRSRVMHSTTEPLRSHLALAAILLKSLGILSRLHYVHLPEIILIFDSSHPTDSKSWESIPGPMV